MPEKAPVPKHGRVQDEPGAEQEDARPKRPWALFVAISDRAARAGRCGRKDECDEVFVGKDRAEAADKNGRMVSHPPACQHQEPEAATR